jgi:asparaginyl-tRNA synthetase
MSKKAKAFPHSVSNNLQNEKIRAIMKVRAKLLDAARQWFNQNGYTEVHGPTIIPAVGDWPSHFEVKYFDKKAYLTQGLQPYADAFMASLGKIYTIAPAFRTEKRKTKRHLTEYWRLEAAIPHCNLDGIIRVQEELVTHICQSLSKEAMEELKCLHRHVNDMLKVKTHFPRLTYDEAIEMLQRDGFDLVWGEELSWELENHLSLRFDQPFFITEFPIGIQTFFYKSHPKKPELTLSVDLLAPEGYGEIAGGGQMIDEKEVLLKKMAEEKIEPEDQRWYMDLRQYGSVTRSGFMLGLERLIQWICKLQHIRETTEFPRLVDSIYP